MVVSLVTPPPAPPCILVVDDDDEVREITLSVLADAGYEVLAAADGREAIELLGDTLKIDLLLTDVVMPGIDGIALGNLARARFPALRIIYATGFLNIAQALPGGLHGKLISKPFAIADLEAEIAVALA